MDSFIEQIVLKKTEASDTLKRFGLIFGGTLLFFISAIAALLLVPYILMLGLGAVWLAWYLIQGTYVEYEYIITNDEMDIDKIIARKKRKRLITVKINTAEEWGEYTEGKEKDALVTVSAHDCGYKNLWYIIARHEKHGKTAVLFSPNRAVLEAMNKRVPYTLRKSELKQSQS